MTNEREKQKLLSVYIVRFVSKIAYKGYKHHWLNNKVWVISAYDEHGIVKTLEARCELPIVHLVEEFYIDWIRYNPNALNALEISPNGDGIWIDSDNNEVDIDQLDFARGNEYQLLPLALEDQDHEY